MFRVPGSETIGFSVKNSNLVTC